MDDHARVGDASRPRKWAGHRQVNLVRIAESSHAVKFGGRAEDSHRARPE
ncbi:hypothetical protein [Micromonospora musae]